MKITTLLWCSLLLLGQVSVGRAQDSSYLQQENAQLRRRLERLENALEELKKATLARSTPAPAPAPAAPAPGAEAAQGLQQENAQLKQRLEKLESALAGLNQPGTKPPSAAPAAPVPAAAQPAASPATPAQPAPTPAAASAAPAPAAPAPALTGRATTTVPLQLAGSGAETKKPVEAPKLPALAGDKKSVLSSLDIEIYGIVKADASYDSARTYPGNYVLYVESEASRPDDNEFNVTANQTRLGARIQGPASETLKTSGLVEIDFYGNYASENKAKIQMRHAYVTVEWPKSRLSVLAGQTSDIISPLVPNTLNYTVLWDAGNVGYRRPQIRATHTAPLGEKASLKTEAGIARTIGRTDPTGSETGEDAGFPSVQGRVSATFPLVGAKPTTVGVSGHLGQEEFDLDATGRHTKFDSWSVNLDLVQPVTPWLTVLGEWFYGQDLDQYFGGIGQGVNTTTREEIRATGGWLAASLGPWGKWSFNVGAGLDHADAADVPADGRTENSSIFGNVYYSWNKNAQLGVELSRWNTHYQGSGDADDLRAQTSFLYKF